MTTTIQLFKEFTEETLKEHLGKKDLFDECIDVYSNTQMFDVSNIASNQVNMFSNEYLFSPDYTHVEAKREGEMFFLPFESCFVKIKENKWDNNIDYHTAFFHDYKPNVITGAFVFATKTPKELVKIKIPFVIKNILNSIHISFDTSFIANSLKSMVDGQEFKDRIERFINSSLKEIMDVIYVFNKLSKQTILLDTPIIDRPTYYRYRNKERGTLKVNSKPIYIVLDKEKINMEHNHDNIEKQGKLERNFAFPVIGHWRRLEATHKLGKDRNGTYQIEGFTWVKSHIRGDKNSPLVQHERIVINKG